MSSFTINEGLFINITPRGAYYAIQDNAKDVTRNLLIKLLQLDETPQLSSETLSEICQLDEDDAFNLLHRMQKLGLVSGQEIVEVSPEDNLESILPELLASLSDSQKVLLAEHSGLYLGASGFPHEAAEELAAISANLSEVYQRHKGLLQDNLGFNQHAWGLIDGAGNSGLYLGASGFPHEAAEELAAISANLSEVYQRHKGLLQDNLGFNQHAWGLIDGAGNSEVGFWPLYVGFNQFTLVIHGMPQLNKPAFKHLVWSLVKRYGQA